MVAQPIFWANVISTTYSLPGRTTGQDVFIKYKPLTSCNMTLEDLDFLLKNSTPDEIFATGGEKRLGQLRKVCHPDRNPGCKIAAALYQLLDQVWDKFKNPVPPITSPTAKYRPVRIVATGDVSDLHFAKDDDDKEYLLKISRIAGGEALLKTEATNLKKIIDKAKGGTYVNYFPQLVESFPAKDKIQKHINVFRNESGFFNFEEVHAQHPALDGRHLAWIFKRLLTAIGFAHKAGVVHGSILPAHALVYPGIEGQKDDKAHALLLVGWGHSVETGNPLKTISAKWRDWYAPEVLAKKAAVPQTDIFMAARCMVYLAGGDPLAKTMPPEVPKLMATFFKSLLVDGVTMRPAKAWDLYEDFSDLLKRLYGPPKFHNLALTRSPN